ncbi:hypothetical protein K438DRAFT_311338 [Mycena galopus ATCC 62051]|nr:hypothetical protein K438DRAFT_311338 [Mycena galopus ATCC 62051]
MAYPGQQHNYGPPAGGPPGYGGAGAGGGYRPPAGGPPPQGGYAPPAGGPPGHAGSGYRPPPGGPPGQAGSGYGPPPGAPPGGGFAPPGGHGMPHGADPQLWGWFQSVDMDRSGSITAEELQRALINGDWTPFDLDTVKLLMTIFDTDRSGTITFAEFAGLWKYIKDWQGVFRHFDRDRSGSIEQNELRDALAQFGFNLSPNLLMLVERKYDPQAGPARGREGQRGQPAPGITFDRFVRACVVVKQLHEAFGRLDTDRDGWIQIGYEGFMETVLSLP